MVGTSSMPPLAELFARHEHLADSLCSVDRKRDGTSAVLRLRSIAAGGPGRQQIQMIARYFVSPICDGYPKTGRLPYPHRTRAASAASRFSTTPTTGPIARDR